MTPPPLCPFSRLLYLWATVAQRRLPVSWETRSHGWTVSNPLMAHFLLQGMMGSRPSHTRKPLPPAHCSSTEPNRRCEFFSCSFMTTTTTAITNEERTRNSNVRMFPDSFQREARWKKESAINFQRSSSSLWCFHEASRRLTIPQGLAGTRRSLLMSCRECYRQIVLRWRFVICSVLFVCLLFLRSVRL